MSDAVFGAPTFAQLEASLRTGDVVLYNDNEATFATRRTRRLLRRASGLARLLACLPCASHDNLSFGAAGGGDGTDDEDRDDSGAGVCRLDFEGEFDETRQAAFVIELVDETHSNPQNDPKKMLPYLFVPADRTIVPMRDFVSTLRGDSTAPRFALRRLLIAHEQNAQHTVNKQRVRAVLGQRLFQHCK